MNSLFYFYIFQYNKSSTDRAKEDIKSALDALNSHLLTKTFLVRQLLKHCIGSAFIALKRIEIKRDADVME
jgi:hypothetical protein